MSQNSKSIAVLYTNHVRMVRCLLCEENDFKTSKSTSHLVAELRS